MRLLGDKAVRVGKRTRSNTNRRALIKYYEADIGSLTHCRFTNKTPQASVPLELVRSDNTSSSHDCCLLRVLDTLASLFVFTVTDSPFKMPVPDAKPKTLYDKVFYDHIVDEQSDGTILLYIG